MSAAGAGAAGVGAGGLLRLAWPAALSYLLNNTYRINDQFWVQGLGPQAQAALAAVLFVTILNFALIIVCVAGTLTLVARATGAGDPRRRDAVVRSALGMGLCIAAVLAGAGWVLTPAVVGAIGLEGETARLGVDYLRALYLGILPLTLAPAVDHVLLGMGNARLPALLQILAVALNWVLNPVLIYGPDASASAGLPGAQLAASLARGLGIEAHGMGGAAAATAISRGVSVAIGLLLLTRLYGVRLLPGAGAPREGRRLALQIARISLPIALSILLYSGVYLVLIELALVPLGPDALAALGIGFSVFEGVSYPLYLGLAMAAAALVGQQLGAGRPDLARATVRTAQRVAWVSGGVVLALFLGLAPRLAPAFASSPGVLDQLVGYVVVLAFAQPFVAHEALHEKVLLGAGHTRPAMWVSMLGNAARVPLCWALGIALGWGSIGVWIGLDLTSAAKAFLQWRLVRSGRWLEPPAALAAPADAAA